jgi:hypothetical protein
MPTALTRRALGRALLARQLLLHRSKLPVTEAVEHLVGLQAQAPAPPYFALWSRLVGFTPAQLSDRISDRSVVRIVLMRGTIHLVSAADCLALRPVMAPMLERSLVGNTTYGKAKLAGLDLAEVAGAARTLVEEKPRTMAELRTLLGPQWPDRDPVSLAQTARSLLPLVQVPPRGLWGTGGQPACTTAESWLGRPLAEPSPERMVLRYLAAFGPATVRDIQAWSGLTRLAEVTERLGSRLVRLRTADGAELLDLPDAPRPDPDVPAPVRFLAPFDNALLSHADRSRILDEDARKVVFASVNGQIPGTILVDGTVRGIWRIHRNSELRIDTIRPLSKRHASSVTAEGNRLLRFAEPDAQPEVVIRSL